MIIILIMKGRRGGADFTLTPQRLAVMEHLKDNKEHPSAEEIYRAVRRRFPTMSFATVYNTLELLKERGMVTELALEARRKRFDPDTRPHHHLICTGCRRIVDVHTDYMPDIGDAEGFEITGARIEFYGLCPRCMGKSSKR
jgi:Fur family peroxide stress response transcriptional regulator